MGTELDDFRADARAWLQENCPKELVGMGADETTGFWGGRNPEPSHPEQVRWLDIMGEKGWTAPTWPTEYGGGGLDRVQEKALRQEMAALRVPPALVGFGLTMIGPTLLRFGTDAQKQEHLTKIIQGKIRWCQGYSEPGAGSDLASLQTRAVREGDEFVVNGQKVWTSYGDKSDWIFALVRTNPEATKHNGITFLLMDMNQPGVTVKPIKLISGSSPFCETYFDDARGRVENVIGEIDGGWTVAKALLGHERSMIADLFGTGSGRQAAAQKHSAPVRLAMERLGTDEQGRVADPGLRDELVQLEMDQRCLALSIQRTRDAAKAGHQPGAESSFFKVYGTELNQRRSDVLMRTLGPDGLGWEGPGFEADELKTTRDWLRTRGNTIEGGTSEVQLNIIAKRVLGLPD